MNNNIFTQDELRLLSDALIIAIRSNSEAAKLTISGRVIDAIRANNDVLAYLNTKICRMMERE